ncbi:MarR family transcriptional regulator [Zhengella mangrovi]|uniref:MarR family transcriptional regulator n=1 Tax=Zhengella mangrovi TaxID=1982044 RepID=A0A2G1QKE2_9HYPH|nr:MarR family transcriptional regulator [Zhengella mangrovi]PHP66003.1 MarR family transcriptional regulator [Zhengella mangrovi]
MKTSSTEGLGILLHDASRLLRKRFESRTAEHGLSSAQWRLLVHVSREGAMTQARLGERLEIEPISVSRLVDRMEQAGWVVRKADETDRRVRLVTATAKTQKVFEEVRSIANDVYDEALAGLSVKDRQGLMGALRLLIDNLSDGECAAACATGKQDNE